MHLVSDKSMCEQLCSQRENEFQHTPIDHEVAFYESICSGDIDAVKSLATPLCSKGYGVLSKNPLQNLKYHFTISVAMITRFCVNGGMTSEEAYSLSDAFIIKADECKEEKQVHELHKEMIVSFTDCMKKVKNSKVYSKPIVQTIDYVNGHLHQRIMIAEIADHLSLSVSYLSRLFKTETDMTLSEYINIKKVEAATDMLQFTNYSNLEISTLLCFSSQSYFIKIFRKYVGMTPKNYKKKSRFPEWKNLDQKTPV
ncbi:MAG: AraC family transcriptional regulator [Oscillospiraceae bacterium]|nr:AraC family transcriptional regulator [Oscillospiraceae bacterium]